MRRKPILIRVSRKDIAEGERRDGFSCPIALAASRETGDDCSLHDSFGGWHIDICGRYLEVPYEMAAFAMAFDREEEVSPSVFVLPPLNDPRWEEKCYRCEELFDQGDLDDEGVCSECRKPKNS